ncbi:alginate O-acetyltransferase [Deinococcus sonorensis]|uniref:Probable alginate O-acetylase AlgJ n=2 Tax=Deinococcus sonorensis TaxID=309891 RepID=A0AAU7UD75_9DEIO
MTDLMREQPRPSTPASPDPSASADLQPAMSTPALMRALPGLFLVAVVGAGAVLSVLGDKGAKIWVRPVGQSVMQGSAQATFEHNYDAHHPVRDPGIDTWGLINYALFREGRPGVLIGDGDWLYTTEEFLTTPDDAREVTSKLQYIRQVRDQLAAHGTRLVVALVPAKARVYSEHLGRYRVPAVKAQVYQQFLQRLAHLNIPAPNLQGALQAAKPQGDVFLHTDTHWTPLGASAAARSVAASIRQHYPDLQLPHNTFETTTRPATSYSGDLLSFVRVGALKDRMGPQREPLSIPATTRTDDAGGGLLGDDAVAVTLVGTSYSAIQSWNFEGALKTAVASDVLNVSLEGKGPIVPMQQYLTSETFRTQPPQLLIWEIPERFLDTPTP